MDYEKCDDRLLELGKYISKIKGAIKLVAYGEIFEGEDDYIRSYHMIDECIETLNSECRFNLKHLNFYNKYENLLTLGLNKDNVSNYLKEWYEPVDKIVREHFGRVNMNPIEQNALYVLKILVDNNMQLASGKKIEEVTNFDPQAINDAIEYLEDLNAVKVMRYLGTSPYDFGQVEVNTRGRYLYHELFSDEESKGTILTEDEINPPILAGKKLPERPYNPLGSPYGFTEDDWETVSLKKKNRCKLNVVFGLQYESDYYITDDIINNIKIYFEEAVTNFNSKDLLNCVVELKFEKLAAGLGEHVFNKIASDIISSDIAVFEVSDRNPNVMIEMGVALTWGVRVLPLREIDSPDVPSDISGHSWVKYSESGEKINDDSFQEKLDEMVERAIIKKGR